MQCNQPLWCTGYQNTAQFPPYQTHPHYPEVTGEGDLVPWVLPDGSMQYFFLPTNRRDRWPPYFPVPNATFVWPTPNNEAWFVRSVLNTCPTSVTDQIWNDRSVARTYTNDSSPIQGYIQKFHNDGWTSTTDLQYFYPDLRSGWMTKGCTAVQVELPKDERTIFHYGTVCSKPCNCAPKVDMNTVTYADENCCTEPMSVDDTNPDDTLRCCCADVRVKGEKKNKYSSCECDSYCNVGTADKLVTTYADQGSSAIDVKGRDKRRKKMKKNSARSSKNDVEVCHSASCLRSPCSETECCD